MPGPQSAQHSDTTAQDSTSSAGGNNVALNDHPRSIGDYRIIEVLGEGELGAVYRARPANADGAEVLIKLIRQERAVENAASRLAEGHAAIGRMSHLHIATLGAGVNLEGRPYFVTELISGEPLTAYCDRVRLPARERFLLFLEVCRAMQHAHEQGVVHGGIEPSTVLVARVGEEPVVKIIDFGVMAATVPSETDSAKGTVDTPQYVSPEQAQPAGGTLDARTDVYCLGVLLYELLVGEGPYPTLGSVQGDLHAVRAILASDVPPPRPSEHFESHEANIGPRIDRIVLKAMAKDPSARYSSAAALAADVHDCLDPSDPEVTPDPIERIDFQEDERSPGGSWAQRGPMIAAVILALALASVVGAWQSSKQGYERERAQLRVAQLQQLQSLVFPIDQQIRGLEGAAPAREYLMTRATTLLEDYAGETAAIAELRRPLLASYQQLGKAQGEMGRAQEALVNLEKSSDFAAGLLEEDPEDIEVRRHLGLARASVGSILRSQGKTDASLSASVEATEMLAPVVTAEPGDVDVRATLSRAHHDSGTLLAQMDRKEDAVRHCQRAVALWEDIPSAQQPRHAARSLVETHDLLARTLTELGRLEPAVDSYRKAARALEAHQETEPGNVGAKHRLAAILDAEGKALLALGRPDESVIPLKRSIDLQQAYVDEVPAPDARRELADRHLTILRAYSSSGSPKTALKHSLAGVALCEKLIEENSEDREAPDRLVDLLLERSRILIERAEINSAVKALERAAEVNDSLSKESPGHAEYRVRRSDIDRSRGDAYQRRALGKKIGKSPRLKAWKEARRWWNKSQEALSSLNDDGLLADVAALESGKASVARADSAIAALGKR